MTETIVLFQAAHKDAAMGKTRVFLHALGIVICCLKTNLVQDDR